MHFCREFGRLLGKSGKLCAKNSFTYFSQRFFVFYWCCGKAVDKVVGLRGLVRGVRCMVRGVRRVVAFGAKK